MAPPEISVIICSYNGHERIGAAIESVLAQSCANLEVLIIDDGSPQSLEPLFAPYRDGRLRFFRAEQNRGLHACRRWGVELAQGELIALLDDDDAWQPEKLSRQLSLLLASPQVGLVCTGAVDRYPDGTEMVRLPPSPVISYAQELVDECTIASSVLFRRAAYEAVGGFDGSLRRCGDWDCWIRLAKRFEMRGLLEPLVVTTMRPNSLQRSGDIEAFASDRWRVVEKHAGELQRLGLWAKARARQYHSVGVRYLRAGNFPQARSYLGMALQQEFHLDTAFAYVAAALRLPDTVRLRRVARHLKTTIRRARRGS